MPGFTPGIFLLKKQWLAFILCKFYLLVAALLSTMARYFPPCY